jgi:hypothetical protein
VYTTHVLANDVVNQSRKRLKSNFSHTLHTNGSTVYDIPAASNCNLVKVMPLWFRAYLILECFWGPNTSASIMSGYVLEDHGSVHGRRGIFSVVSVLVSNKLLSCSYEGILSVLLMWLGHEATSTKSGAKDAQSSNDICLHGKVARQISNVPFT